MQHNLKPKLEVYEMSATEFQDLLRAYVKEKTSIDVPIVVDMVDNDDLDMDIDWDWIEKQTEEDCSLIRQFWDYEDYTVHGNISAIQEIFPNATNVSIYGLSENNGQTLIVQVYVSLVSEVVPA